jgi:hypothetical protein
VEGPAEEVRAHAELRAFVEGDTHG